MKFTKTQRSRRGASLLSYGLIVGLISVVALSAVTQTGSNVNALFAEVETSLNDVVTGNAGGGGSATPEATPSGPTTCLSLFNAGTTTDGAQTIDLPGGGTASLFCDMTTNGGGWTLVGKIGENRSGHFTRSAVNISDLNNNTLTNTSETKLADTDMQGLAATEFRMICGGATVTVSSSSCTFDATARADLTGCATGGSGDAPSIEFGISDAVSDTAWNLSMGGGCEFGGDRDDASLWVR